MPSRCDWLAAVPKCDRAAGQGNLMRPCCLPMRWIASDEPGGRWVCIAHGPVLTGRQAAERAGFVLRFEDAA